MLSLFTDDSGEKHIHKWTEEEVNLLITAYKSVALANTNMAQFWDKVEEEMKKLDTNISKMACKIKWRKLETTYWKKRNKNKIKNLWPYYREMHEALNINNKSNSSTSNYQPKISDYFQKTK